MACSSLEGTAHLWQGVLSFLLWPLVRSEINWQSRHSQGKRTSGTFMYWHHLIFLDFLLCRWFGEAPFPRRQDCWSHLSKCSLCLGKACCASNLYLQCPCFMYFWMRPWPLFYTLWFRLVYLRFHQSWGVCMFSFFSFSALVWFLKGKEAMPSLLHRLMWGSPLPTWHRSSTNQFPNLENDSFTEQTHS